MWIAWDGVLCGIRMMKFGEGKGREGNRNMGRERNKGKGRGNLDR